MLQIKRIGILSIAKIMGVIYACFGILAGAMFSCFALTGFAASFAEGGQEAMGLLFGVGAIIIMPIMYGIMGFIGGAITGFIYNLVAGFIGGIEIYTE